MDNLAADFIINPNNALNAEYQINEGEHFACSFELYAGGVVWGNIDGDINNQTDLINILNGKADISYVDNTITDLAGTVTDNYNTLSGEISALSTTIDNNYTSLDNRLITAEQGVLDLTDIINTYGDIVTYSAADFATYNQGVLANTALQPGDNITELVNNAGYITAASLPTVNNNTITIQKNGTNIDSFTLNQNTNKSINITVPTNTNELTNGAGFITSADLPTLADLTTTAQLAAINSGATSTNIAQIATNTQDISDEITNRQNADNGLQSQIDALVVSSDVFDIVGTYAELQAYDISTVPVNDIIKVLVDSTHNNAATYYRCVENNNVKSWSYIGAEGAYYTKSESDNRFVAQTITVNGQPLSSNVTLTASDVGALPDSTTIPTATSQLTNDSGYITGITSSDVTTALGYTPYNATNPNGYTSNVGTVTSVNNTQPDSNGNVTITIPDTATWGNITGTLSDQTDLQNALNAKLNTSDITEYTAAEVETLWGSI